MNTSDFVLNTSRPRRSARLSILAAKPGSAAVETLILIALAILLVVGIVTSSGREHASSGSTHSAQPTARVLVEKGDTLWSMAVQHPIEGQSTQQTAAQIAELNGRPQSTLAAGTVIDVPAPIHRSTAVACR